VDLPRYVDDGLAATVFLGDLGEVASPATTHSALVGAELRIDAGATATIPLRSAYEYAVLVLEGSLSVGDVALEAGPLLYLGMGRDRLDVASDVGARLVLLGGEPFEDDLVMWWNFVGRRHEEIAAARADWESSSARSQRFGTVAGHDAERIPAPELPSVRLSPRRRR
jgi:quercetin 2,3-dioxygenase